MQPQLVILSGPSCMGKTPLTRALRRDYPHLAERFQDLVLINSRPARPGEVDGVEHAFRDREVVESLRQDHRFAVVDVRGDLQALELAGLQKMLGQGDVFYEGNPYVARMLQTLPLLEGIRRVGIFLAPLSRDEVQLLRERGVTLPEFVRDLMQRKLRRRAQRQLGRLTERDEHDIAGRAARAFAELQMAHCFDFVIPNHDGEDSDHWETAGSPIGDALRTLRAVATILRGEIPDIAEPWSADLLEPPVLPST